MLRLLMLSILIVTLGGCVTRGVNGPCGFIGPNGAYIPCSAGGMPSGAWAYGTRKYYQGPKYWGYQGYQPSQRFRNSRRQQ
jgi:hypothetical protein